jgi:hypothetical protein
MPGLRSDVNALAGGALVACATAAEGQTVPGSVGRAAPDRSRHRFACAHGFAELVAAS